MANDDILNVQQVAAQFSVTPQTVRSWIDSGKLKAGRVGKAYRILRRDVYAMLEDAAAERQTPDHDMWQDRAAAPPADTATERASRDVADPGAKRAVLPRRPA